MSYKARHRERGSTLIESLVALGLFGLMASAMGSLFTTHIRAEGSNVRRTAAIALVEQEFEDLRSLDYDSIMSRSSTSTTGHVTYTLTTTVVPDMPAPNMKTITATLTWTDNYGPQTYSANAIYTAVTR